MKKGDQRMAEYINSNMFNTFFAIIERISKFIFRYTILPFLIIELGGNWYLQLFSSFLTQIWGRKISLSFSGSVRRLMFGAREYSPGDDFDFEESSDDLGEHVLDKNEMPRGRVRQAFRKPTKMIKASYRGLCKRSWGLKSDLFLTLERADYLFERYIKHSPLCIIHWIYPREADMHYYFNGIELTRYDGYKEYRRMHKLEARFARLHLQSGLVSGNSGDQFLLPLGTSTRDEDVVEPIKKHLVDLKEYTNQGRFNDRKEKQKEWREEKKVIQVDRTINNESYIINRSTQSDKTGKSEDSIMPAANSHMHPHLQKILDPTNFNGEKSTSLMSLSEDHVSNIEKGLEYQGLDAKRDQNSLKVINIEIPKSKKTIKLSISSKKSSKVRPTTSSIDGIDASNKIIRSIEKNDTVYLFNIIEAIKKSLPKQNYDDGSFAPIVVRLAWHCCATYDKATKTGGSNGATMRFVPEITDEGNTGLDIARALLEPIKQKFPRITYSDLWTLAGKVAIEEMQGPSIPWRCGRIDCMDDTHVPPNGRLPFGYKDADHIRQTFSRMGFDDRETVVLLGTHGLGRCHRRYSGWEGKWTRNPIKFSNEFYKVLLHEKWSAGIVPETGRSQYFNEDKTLMMLKTDLELIRDPSFLQFVKLYADDEFLFFKDYAIAFGKLLELGIERDMNGKVILNEELRKLQN